MLEASLIEDSSEDSSIDPGASPPGPVRRQVQSAMTEHVDVLNCLTLHLKASPMQRVHYWGLGVSSLVARSSAPLGRSAPLSLTGFSPLPFANDWISQSSLREPSVASATRLPSLPLGLNVPIPWTQRGDMRFAAPLLPGPGCRNMTHASMLSMMSGKTGGSPLRILDGRGVSLNTTLAGMSRPT